MRKDRGVLFENPFSLSFLPLTTLLTSLSHSMSDYDTLAASYRAQLRAKLPTSAILSQEFLARYPPGSNVTSVPAQCGLLTPRQLEITETVDASALLELLASGTYTAEETLLAFGTRTAIAHQVTQCLTDFWLEHALEQARELDRYRVETGKLKGPLHGLPVSLKVRDFALVYKQDYC